MQYLTLLTDWTLTDPRYFWLRGAVWGIVVSSLFWRVFYPWAKTKARKRSQRLAAEAERK